MYYLKARAPPNFSCPHVYFHLKFDVGWERTGKRERNCKYKFIKYIELNLRNP